MKNKITNPDQAVAPPTGSTMWTYRQLLDFLATLTPAELAQPVQLLGPNPDGDKPTLLDHVFGGGTVENLCHVDGEVCTETRSGKDFQHHPELVVLMMDGCPYDETGATAWTMDEDEDGEGILIGDNTGIVKPWIERDREGPTVKASRTAAFADLLNETTEQLLDEQERLAEISRTGSYLHHVERLNDIQAELYRRRYRLPARNERSEDKKP